MPRKAKKFPRLTHASARRAVLWAVVLLRLDDYFIDLWIQDNPPEWCEDVSPGTQGIARTRVSRKHVGIWLSPARLADEGIDPLSAVFHEVLHVLFKDAGIRNDGGDNHVHGMVYRLSAVLAAAYRAKVKV